MKHSTLVFLDESGFRLLPMVVRTWALRGQTPILRVPLKWSRLSVISAITHEGRLLTRIQKKGFRSPQIVQFLKHILRHVQGDILIVWDNLSAHGSKLVQQFIESQKRLDCLHLPPYAPDLNPVEFLWSYLKKTELANVCCQSLEQLRYEIRKALERVRHKRDVLLAFVHHLYDTL